MEVRAVAKNVRRSPQKVRQVAGAVRGRSVSEALALLQLMPQASARELYKVVKSAASNAENNYEFDVKELYVHRIYVNEGPTLKRYKARAYGRTAPRFRRSSHITAIVQEKGAE